MSFWFALRIPASDERTDEKFPASSRKRSNLLAYLPTLLALPLHPQVSYYCDIDCKECDRPSCNETETDHRISLHISRQANGDRLQQRNQRSKDVDH